MKRRCWWWARTAFSSQRTQAKRGHVPRLSNRKNAASSSARIGLAATRGIRSTTSSTAQPWGIRFTNWNWESEKVGNMWELLSILGPIGLVGGVIAVLALLAQREANKRRQKEQDDEHHNGPVGG